MVCQRGPGWAFVLHMNSPCAWPSRGSWCKCGICRCLMINALTPSWLGQHVQREASRCNQEMPDLIGLCGTIAQPWLHASVGGVRVRQLSTLPLASDLFEASI